ncbi:hypothetical protein VPH35_055673 [Triticum aestivum]|uniref:Uncharacterized protein n=2 Tax=Triticum TaxID=4564 RepID=A0A9R1QWH2_TRITD|nr:unnamed protein product [Triticum aestivum]VAH84979.1 unnamed protein product [Triticum turgidum subsp. durum]
MASQRATTAAAWTNEEDMARPPAGGGLVSGARGRRRRSGARASRGQRRSTGRSCCRLDKFGKGDWAQLGHLPGRTPTHKCFIRLNSMNRDRRRSSIHDITTINNAAPQPQHGPVTGGVMGMYGGAPMGHPVAAAVGTPGPGAPALRHAPRLPGPASVGMPCLLGLCSDSCARATRRHACQAHRRTTPALVLVYWVSAFGQEDGLRTGRAPCPSVSLLSSSRQKPSHHLHFRLRCPAAITCWSARALKRGVSVGDFIGRLLLSSSIGTPANTDLAGRSLSCQGRQPSTKIEGASPASVLVSWWFPTSQQRGGGGVLCN